MKLTKVLILALCFYFNLIFCQDSIKNQYIKPLKEHIQLRLDVNTDIREFKFDNPEPFKDFNTLPNESYQTRILVSYKWLNLAYSFSPKIAGINNDEEEKGKSKIFGLDLSLNFKKYQAHLFYRKVNGYYLSNSDDYRNELTASGYFGRYALLPDFQSIQIGVENYYYYNGTKFSSRFARTQNEIQIKSAGSVVSFLGYYYSDIDGSKQNFDFLQFLLEQGNIYPYRNKSSYLVGGTGYAYNWIISKHFYATGLLAPGIGVQFSKLEYPLNYPSQKSTELTIAGLGEFSLGYNSEHWYGGIFTNMTAYTSPTAENKLSGQQTYLMAFIGYRFGAPKPVKKVFEKVEKIFK